MKNEMFKIPISSSIWITKNKSIIREKNKIKSDNEGILKIELNLKDRINVNSELSKNYIRELKRKIIDNKPIFNWRGTQISWWGKMC